MSQGRRVDAEARQASIEAGARARRAMGRARAEERRRVELERAWREGYIAGWDDGVSDAIEDDPGPRARNPYRPTTTTTEKGSTS